MKKIYSLFVALSIVLCAMADSPYFLQKQVSFEETTKAVKLNKQESRQAMVEARQAKTVAPMAINGVRQMESVQTIAKQAIPANAARKAPAKAAAEATDTVAFTAARWSYQYYSESGDWWMAVLDPTGTYRLDFDYIVPEENFAGTYTIEDLDLGYSYLTVADAEGYVQYVDYVEVTLTVTSSAEGKFLTANVLCENGIRYLVTAAELPLPEPLGKVDLAYTTANLIDATASSEAFQFWANENDIYTSFLIYSDQVEGEYTEKDMYSAAGNYIMFAEDGDTTFVDFLGFELEITKEGKTYNLVADALGTDTILYHITMSYTKPDPTDTIDIVATNMVVDEFEFFGQLWCTVSASNDEYTVELDMANGLPMGELTSADFNVEWSSVYRIADSTEIAFDDILSATVTEVDGQRAIKAQVVGVDNILYNLDLSYVVPEPTDTVDVVFEEVAETQYWAEYGDYNIYNENENYIVELDIFADKDTFVGEYTAEDFDMYYTRLSVIEAGDTTVVDLAAAKAVVTPVEEGIVLIEAELISWDSVLYKVSTKADVSNKGLPYDATEGYLVDEYTTEDLYSITDYSNYGFIYFDAEAADSTDLMGLQFWVDAADENTTIPVGTYPINDSMEPGTVMASTGMSSQGLTYSLYATLDEEGYIVEPCWFMVGGEVVVSEENGILSITVDAVNSNNLPIYITCKYDLNTKQGLEYDEQTGSVNRTYTAEDILDLNTDYIAQYNLGVDIVAADYSDQVSLLFFVPAADPEIGIPAGTYPIASTPAMNTILAAEGVNAQGQVAPSFYSTLVEQGGKLYLDKIYFMVSGQAVVENINGKLKMTIDAVNSYDVPIHIVYDASATAVENIVTGNTNNASKVVENGQLMIIKNDVKYNVLGSVVK